MPVIQPNSAKWTMAGQAPLIPSSDSSATSAAIGSAISAPTTNARVEAIILASRLSPPAARLAPAPDRARDALMRYSRGLPRHSRHPGQSHGESAAPEDTL